MILKFLKLLISYFTVKKAPDVLPSDMEPPKDLDANVPIDGPKTAPEPLSERIAAFTESMLGKDSSPYNRAPKEVACAETVAYLLHHELPEFPEDIVGTIELNQALKSLPQYFKRVSEPTRGSITVYPSIKVDGVITKNGHAFIYITNDKMCSNDSRTGLLKQNYTRQKAIDYYHNILGLKGYIYAPVD